MRCVTAVVSTVSRKRPKTWANSSVSSEGPLSVRTLQATRSPGSGASSNSNSTTGSPANLSRCSSATTSTAASFHASNDGPVLSAPSDKLRAAARTAITRLRLSPIMFELGARPHAPRELYRAYLAQSEVFVGIYWQQYGWVAPGEEVSGLEDEYLLSGDKPKLIYMKAAAERQARLTEMLARVEADDRASYKRFDNPDDLAELLADDLAVLLTERFARPVPAAMPDRRPASLPVPLTPIIGREDEIAAVIGLLRDPDVHLVTLIGPGGIGKTRLAIEVARKMSTPAPGELDGVSFIDLAAVRDAVGWAEAVTAVLGIRAECTRPVLDLLIDR